MNRQLQGWRPTPFLQASLALNGCALALGIAEPAQWPWALGTIGINQTFVATIGLWPRSTWLGANITRLDDAAASRGEVWITIDDGPDPAVTPQVLKILETHGARASFFCIGEHVRRHAALAREVVAAGHAIENHSEHHLHRFSLLGPRGMADEVSRAQDSIEAVTGKRPRYFRAPAGLRNPFLDYVLHRQGIKLASWTRRGFDTREKDHEKVLARLTKDLSGGDILLLHDGHAARSDGQPIVLKVLPRLLDAISAKGLRAIAV